MAGVQQSHGVDWKDSAKELAKALAKGGASALVRGILVISVSTVLNLAFSVIFFFLAGLAGGGHGSLLAFPLALVPFAPFVVLAVVLAQKQGVMRLVAGAVESQAPTIAKLGSHYLGGFLRERYGNLRETKLGAGFDKGWQHYLKSRDASWPVRVVIGQVTSRVPLGEIIDELGRENVPSEDVPRQAMDRVIKRISEERLRPSWLPILVLFGVNMLWFPIITLLIKG